ncbi:uncharacterized protein PHACADRAFT_251470 [Phanerochaete carnosa HHB-10118-sp]|uniref:Uncharacterized protein n=1 Tax=Phanerochaete carnosa (strain HHB-10118-sp) TaxID=650164 RepID=K5X4C8_PHACS|nr:uncharacterized protein PHACADRAFT_251470 [Phanerochaete carnosa HHB-10118-sp]EKM57687.1 hypothetical protein PHACADRAFT_251470 [Phanerochaete carnosa HHB-10118-sp]
MINLRTIDSEVPDYFIHSTTDRRQGQLTLQFRRPTNRLGSIGGTLQIGWDDNGSHGEEIDRAEVDEAGSRENSVEV